VAAVAPPESSAAIVKLYEPAVVGFPEISPADDSEIPLGKAPAVSLKLYEELGPLAASCWLYTTPTVPAAIELGLIDVPDTITRAVGADEAAADPAPLDAVTSTRIVKVTSAEPRT